MSGMPNFYPKLDENALKQAVKLAANPGYLDDPLCPWSKETKDFFRPKAEDAPEEDLELIELSAMSADALTTEIDELYTKLKKQGDSLGGDDGMSENSYFRIMATLMEKVVDMKTRLADSINITKFQEEVLQILEDLTADQRNEFMERIGKLRKHE